MTRHISVSKVPCYGMDDLNSIPDRGRDFVYGITFRPALGRSMGPGATVTSNQCLQNVTIFTSVPPHLFMTCCLIRRRDKFKRTFYVFH